MPRRTITKSRGRPPNASRTKTPTTTAAAPTERKKRTRSSMDQAEQTGQARPSSKAAKGRKRKAAPKEAGEGSSADEAQPSSKAAEARKRTTMQTETGEEGWQPEPSGSRMRRASEADVDPQPTRSPKKKYQLLKPRTRNVKMHSKWAPLSATAMQQVHEVFSAATRPVIQSRQDGETREKVQRVLANVLRRLEKKVSRAPLPPKTREMHFNTEMLLERNRELENTLTPAMHSVELLKTEVEKEEEALRRDRALLAELKTNAKAHQQSQHQRTRKAHPLLRSVKTTATDDDAVNINMVRGSAKAVGLDDVNDSDLKPLLDQLRNHIESMQTNSAQVEGVEDALSGAQTAVDGILFKRLDAQQYDRLMASSSS